MCGRLSQYSGIHDFVAALSMPNALANSVGEAPLERYNVAPTTQVALLHQQDETLHADLVRWGWRPHWAKDRAAPIIARVEKVAHGPFFRSNINPLFEFSQDSRAILHPLLRPPNKHASTVQP